MHSRRRPAPSPIRLQSARTTTTRDRKASVYRSIYGAPGRHFCWWRQPWLRLRKPVSDIDVVDGFRSAFAKAHIIAAASLRCVGRTSLFSPRQRICPRRHRTGKKLQVHGTCRRGSGLSHDPCRSKQCSKRGDIHAHQTNHCRCGSDRW